MDQNRNKGVPNEVAGQTNLNHVPIQKGKDPLGALRTKPQTSDCKQGYLAKSNSFLLSLNEEQPSSIKIISFNTTPKIDTFTQNSTLKGPEFVSVPQSSISNAQIEKGREDENKQFPNHSISPNPISVANAQQDQVSSSWVLFSQFRNSNDQRDEKSKQQSITNLFGASNSQASQQQQQQQSEQTDFLQNLVANNSDRSNRIIPKDPSALEKFIEDNYMELRKLKVDREFIMKGEEIKGISETQLKFGQFFVEGQLILTNYQLIFAPKDEDRIWKFIDRKDYQCIPLGNIFKVERIIEKKGLQYSYIDIYCKDGRQYRFKYQPDAQNYSFDMQIKIYSIAFPEDVRKMFCYLYLHYDRQLENEYQGWQTYDIQREFTRQGLIIAPHDFSNQVEYALDYKSSPFKYLDNQSGNICSTYPPFIVVPAKIPVDEIIRCSKFRSRERLPALTYAFKRRSNSNYTTLWRCAQCKLGINQNRSLEDENMLRVIGSLERTATTVRAVKIYDARPYINAVGQQITGKGYEMKQFYKNCDIEFLDIQNIHKVRDSYKKMTAAVSQPSNEYLREVDKSEWFIHLSSIIYGTRQVIDSLLNEISVVIHCSDGWDRTSQLLCLAQMCIDPYYRTIEGFEILIEKDWIIFGHQFGLRTGHGSKNFSDENRSPIFLQFLDCVYQLMEQYPLSFEFNSKFLADIGYHLHSCRFGTFLFNSYQVKTITNEMITSNQNFHCKKEQILNKVQTSTVSLWSYLNSQKEKYINPFFLSLEESNLPVILPDGHVRRFNVWKEHFMIYQAGYCDPYHIYSECKFTEDNKDVLKRITSMRYDQFREENKLLHKKIGELEQQVANKLNNYKVQVSLQQQTSQQSQQQQQQQQQIVIQQPAFTKNPMMLYQQQDQTKDNNNNNNKDTKQQTKSKDEDTNEQSQELKEKNTQNYEQVIINSRQSNEVEQRESYEIQQREFRDSQQNEAQQFQVNEEQQGELNQQQQNGQNSTLQIDSKEELQEESNEILQSYQNEHSSGELNGEEQRVSNEALQVESNNTQNREIQQEKKNNEQKDESNEEQQSQNNLSEQEDFNQEKESTEILQEESNQSAQVQQREIYQKNEQQQEEEEEKSQIEQQNQKQKLNQEEELQRNEIDDNNEGVSNLPIQQEDQKDEQI